MTRAPVILEDYDPTWPKKFAQEKNFLLSVIGRWQHGAVEHIGSTAVPGMAAKPVIDIMFGVTSLEESKPAIEVLVANGYEYWPYKPDIMHWFCKPSDAFRTHHLHLVPYQSELWKQRIKFKELLLSDKEVFNQYKTLKLELAAKFKNDREQYTDEKWPFIKNVLQID